MRVGCLTVYARVGQCSAHRASIRAVTKPHIADLPVEAVERIFREATLAAVANAVRAGQVVASWEDGHLVLYGPGHRPLPPECFPPESK